MGWVEGWMLLGSVQASIRRQVGVGEDSWECGWSSSSIRYKYYSGRRMTPQVFIRLQQQRQVLVAPISIYIFRFLFFEVSALWSFKYFGLQTAFLQHSTRRETMQSLSYPCRLLGRRIASARERVALLLPHLKMVENVSITSLSDYEA